MAHLPRLDTRKHSNESPHVVILGAGASVACAPHGDKFGRRLPIMSNFIETLNIRENFSALKFKINKNFEDLYDELAQEGKNIELLEKLQELIRSYFMQVQIPNRLTLYDRLILSLREKDLIASFNWDPLLVQAYRRNVKFGQGQLPNLVFLHGNVGVGYCEKHRVKNYLDQYCRKCNLPLNPSPLLYPISKKDYTENSFIQSEWKVFERFVENAFLITIYGYSAPKTDMAAREIMRKAWGRNQIRDFTEIEVIDIRPEKELRESWNEFIVREHYMISRNLSICLLRLYPRRSCDAFAWAILQGDPWYERKWPHTSSLKSFQNFIAPILEEELNHLKEGTPFSKWGRS